ncbi:restriction endonuclease subunit S [Photobacterium leiognathi]|uniref:restriction endonuclease subunit S n=1 Tax=Photobacterium leiognathi TaxID=553611 RepID=UPI002981278C|nr:restriction endonuclease subunit S [Photobacterium leiognathi]
MSKYKAYPEYKSLSIKSTDEIPVNWICKKLKWEISAKSGTDEKADDGKFELYGANGIIGKTRTTSVTSNNSTVIIGRVGSAGAITLIERESGVSDNALIIKNNYVNCPKFDYYLLKSQNLEELVSKNAQPLITATNIRDLSVYLPNCVEEREKIAAFLDHETAKIDTLIEKQQQLIELLKEKRQAVISHAVTKGLNPDAPMKDSGVEWLGEVPDHWDVKYLMHLVEPERRIMYGIVLPGPNVDYGVPIVKGGDVKPGRLTLSSLCKTTFEIESKYERSRLKEGDIVYSIRGTIGDVEIVPKEIEGANLTQDAARIAPANGVDNLWLKYALESTQVFSQLEIGSAGAAVKGINICDLKKAYIPIPPESEMLEISTYLSGELNKLNKLTLSTERQTFLLKERRTALISAAVTGKIDVRNWVAPTTSSDTNEAQQEAMA